MTEKPSLPELVERKRRGEKLVMVTAYDAPAARLVEEAGLDLILVGDSAANTVLGYEATVPVTLEEMLVLTRAVRRGARRSLVVGDMPFGSFQVSDEEAVRNGVRFLKEGGADAVKVEGAGPTLARVRALVGAGIPVMGHLGLTPQSATMLGGLKAQSRTAHQARRLYVDALALEEAGCFSLVLEAIPAPVAAQVTAALAIPTIGIGAGPDCDGQVLVYHDVVGLFASPARFVKQYADLRGETLKALEGFASDVRSGAYPEERHTYKMSEKELADFLEGLPTEGQG
jgi:3-methyl-2-oxobutanoate hydroxymethyltransferase